MKSKFILRTLVLAFAMIVITASTSVAMEGLGSLISPGDLARSHADYEGLRQCTKCHKLRGGLPDSKCLDCHDKLADRINQKKGLHATYKDPCIKCHSDHKGPNYSMIVFEEDNFKHEKTEYPLEGKHTSVECKECHTKKGIYSYATRDGSYKPLTQVCSECHKDEHKKQLGNDCESCHTVEGWDDILKFDHYENSDYPLTGKHLDVKCAKCHVKGKYKPIPFKGCASGDCHTDPHKKQFKGQTCKSCHTTKAWDKDVFDHDDRNYDGYKLDGKHRQADCAKCHVKGKFKPINYKSCASGDCHTDPHKKQFKGQTCDSCHTTAAWEEDAFDHADPSYDGYKLDGKHLDADCAKCHVKGKFKPINYKSCASGDCHTDPHKKQFKGQTCKSCHTTAAWEEDAFDHADPSYDGYKLDGKHRQADCVKCHVKGKFKPINYKSCASGDCHTDPHKKQFKAQACDECHVTAAWDKDAFNHDDSKYDGYKLEGKHRETDCAKCHVKGKYKPIKESCITCHKEDDEHKDELGSKCEECHVVDGWKELALDHNTSTDFPLIGEHKNVECSECHTKKNVYKNDARKCLDCHDDTHEGEFEEECKSCHTQFSWQPRNFDHQGRTGFLLEGVHNDVRCKTCHLSEGFYNRVNRQCNQCHTDPHLNQFGSQDCAQCHSGNSWNPTRFNHSETGYPLLGAHRGAICEDCHSNRQYRNTNDLCISCHTSDYNGAPAHASGGFSMDCTECHRSGFTNWDFKHTQVASGCAECHINEARKPASHSTGNWVVCEDCHKSTSAWEDKVFTHPQGQTNCSACHLNDTQRPEDHITGNWTFCEDCHNSNKTWSSVSVNHSALSSGCSACHINEPSKTAEHNAKNWTQCEECHNSTTTWSFTHPAVSNGCADCHINEAEKPANHSIGNWTVCEECHKSTSSWATANFVHPNVTSGCADCHINESSKPADHNVNNWTVCEQCHKSTKSWSNASFSHVGLTTGCADCHINEPNKTAEHNQKNWIECEDCHSTTSWNFTHTTVSSGCASCHTTKPATHTTNNWTVCEECHNSTASWRFSHPSQNTGCATCHLTYSNPQKPSDHNQNNWVVCEECHKSKSAWTFTHVSVTSGCATCHTTKPATHTTNNWTVCEECHNSTSTWSFSHPSQSTGCADCHLTYSNPQKPSDHNQNNWVVCEECHKSKSAWTFTHQSVTSGCATCHTTKPATHTTNNWTVCEDCHNSTSSWSFTHPSQNTGCADCHLTYSNPQKPSDHNQNNWVVCEDCHTSKAAWTFTHVSVTSGCASCHTTKPATHTTNNWTVCEECHNSTSSWSFTHPSQSTGCTVCHLNYSNPPRPANHDQNGWLVCEECHKSTTAWTASHGNISTGCADCHLNRSNPTKPSSHTTYGWVTCEECHTSTNTWSQISFSHPSTTFPLNHKGTNRNDCDACHPNADYGNSGGCIQCHNRKGEKVHKTNSNAACLGCHPKGKE